MIIFSSVHRLMLGGMQTVEDFRDRFEIPTLTENEDAEAFCTFSDALDAMATEIELAS